MRWQGLLFALGLTAVLAVHPAKAQAQATVVPNCGNNALQLQTGAPLIEDQGGNLCISSPANPQPGQGATPYHLVGGTAASTNATLIAAGAHTLYNLSVINTTATLNYLRMYDSGTTPNCASATGAVHSYPIPASTSGAGFVISFPVGEAYINGIAYCVTGGGADNDNTSAVVGIFINGSHR